MIAQAFEDNDFGFTAVSEEYLTKTLKSDTTKSDALKKEIKDLKAQYVKDLNALEKLILPLLHNLLMNPECEYIVWKDREEPIKEQIAKILEITEKKL